MKTINLSQGMVTIVDDDDYENLNKYFWYAHRGHGGSGKFCAVRSVYENGKRVGSEKMHRVIMQAPKGVMVDHINRDDLDNRKENLRLCVCRQNNVNRGLPKNNTTGFKGVFWDKDRKKYRSYTYVHGKHVAIGSFNNKEDAAIAYNNFMRKIHGEYAWQNPIK